MKIIHKIKKLKIEKEVKENPSFILTNKEGGYLYFDTEPRSRYQGFFCYEQGKMFRVVENILPLNASKVDTIINKFDSVERYRGEIIESFFFPEHFNTFVYKLNKSNCVEIFLDVKESYDNRQLGRYYKVSNQSGLVIVEFSKKTDYLEDNSNGIEEYKFFIAIKSDSDGECINEWIKREYSLDKERNSQPYERFVYKAVKCVGRRFVITFGRELRDVIKEANYVFDNLKTLKKSENITFFEKKEFSPINITNPELLIAYISSIDSLRSLIIESEKNGIFAGLPWFFQFWSRDELISSKALMLLGMRKEAEDILSKYLHSIGIYGNIGNKYLNPDLRSADSIGWLFKRLDDYAKIFGANTIFSKRIKKDFFERIEKSVDNLLLYHTESGLARNSSQETWMDTSFDGDDRNGFRIEIQALRLFIYRFMYDLTKTPKYKDLEYSMKEIVRKKFWNGKILADGLDDWTVRPNIFIAEYIYPDLLTKSEWEECFENALRELWLDYGGIASISKSHRLFVSSDTGEISKSYHRGDSWFWINNLAVIVMHRINKKKFNDYIMRIVSASKNEILFSGAIARHAELSSAKELKSQGCLMQAWSSAMFVEMVERVFAV